MATPTTILGLVKWVTGDHFKNSELVSNWEALDASPGTLLCTAATRPTTWTTNQTGRGILETDTGLSWRWNGTAFVRTGPQGYLGSDRETASLGTSSTALVDALSTSVTIPDGGRNVEVKVSGPGVWSTVDLTRCALYRGGTQLLAWAVHGTMAGTAAGQPHPLEKSYLDLAPTAGATTYTFKYAADATFGGTSTLVAALDNPLTLSVVEV